MSGRSLHTNDYKLMRSPHSGDITNCEDELLRIAILELERSFKSQIQRIKYLAGCTGRLSCKVPRAEGRGSRRRGFTTPNRKAGASHAHVCKEYGGTLEPEPADSDDSSVLLSDWGAGDDVCSPRSHCEDCSTLKQRPSVGLGKINEKSNVRFPFYSHSKKKKQHYSNSNKTRTIMCSPGPKKCGTRAYQKIRSKNRVNYNIKQVSWSKTREFEQDKDMRKKQTLKVHKFSQSSAVSRSNSKLLLNEDAGAEQSCSEDSMSLLELSRRKKRNKLCNSHLEDSSWCEPSGDGNEDTWNSSPSSGFLELETSQSRMTPSRQNAKKCLRSPPSANKPAGNLGLGLRITTVQRLGVASSSRSPNIRGMRWNKNTPTRTKLMLGNSDIIGSPIPENAQKMHKR